MKKNTPFNDDEINLTDSLKIIWDGKIKILLIITISFLIGFGYSYQIPKNYLNSLTINASNSYDLRKYDDIQKLITIGASNNTNLMFLDKFVSELKDYNEFFFIIKNTKKFQEDILKFSNNDQEILLLKYSELLEIVQSERKKNDYNKNYNYTLNLIWDDPDEAKKILQDTLNLVSNNLKKKIDDALEHSLEFQKKLTLSGDRERLDYLKEQSTIAKELKIIDNQIDDANLSQSSVSLRINTADIAYYLRGYKAIDKEIELIKTRNYQKFKFVEQELDLFKDTDIKFLDYNIHLTNVKLLKNTKLILQTSILLGLILGLFYVFISNSIQSQTGSKK